MKLINLTPHKITILTDAVIEIQPSGQQARINSQQTVIGSVNNIPIVRNEFNAIIGLPDPQAESIYIVSSLVAQTVRRPDVIAPDTSPDGAVRNKRGQVIAVRRFQTW